MGMIRRLLEAWRGPDPLWLPEPELEFLSQDADLNRLFPRRAPAIPPFGRMEQARRGRHWILISDPRPDFPPVLYRFASEKDRAYWLEQMASVQQRDEGRPGEGGARVPAPTGPMPSRSGGAARAIPESNQP